MLPVGWAVDQEFVTFVAVLRRSVATEFDPGHGVYRAHCAKRTEQVCRAHGPPRKRRSADVGRSVGVARTIGGSAPPRAVTYRLEVADCAAFRRTMTAPERIPGRCGWSEFRTFRGRTAPSSRRAFGRDPYCAVAFGCGFRPKACRNDEEITLRTSDQALSSEWPADRTPSSHPRSAAGRRCAATACSDRPPCRPWPAPWRSRR